MSVGIKLTLRYWCQTSVWLVYHCSLLVWKYLLFFSYPIYTGHWDTLGAGLGYSSGQYEKFLGVPQVLSTRNLGHPNFSMYSHSDLGRSKLGDIIIFLCYRL